MNQPLIAGPLPDVLLATLFPTGVVAIPKETNAPLHQRQPVSANPHAEQTAPQKLEWLGGFQRNIHIIAHQSQLPFLSDTNLQFLQKVLGAVQISLADVAIINSARLQEDYYALQKVLPATIALYFGVEPHSLGVPVRFPYFQVQSWNDCKFLYAPPIEEFLSNASSAITLKRSLWDALKKIFNLS